MEPAKMQDQSIDASNQVLLTKINSMQEDLRVMSDIMLTKMDGTQHESLLEAEILRLQTQLAAIKLNKSSKVVVEEEHINPKSLAELAEPQYYAYFHGYKGLFRANIPLSENHDVKFETIFHNLSNPLPYHMGLFSHHHKVYMVGGQVRLQFEYSPSVYMFDPNRLPKLPISDPTHLAKPKEMPENFKPMVDPDVIQSGDKVYFLSVKNPFRNCFAPFDFQSFDLTKNRFETLESPPYTSGRGNVTGFFSLRNYIYLFITGFVDRRHAYIFDTRSSKWKEHNLDEFDERHILIPAFHVGDVGLSHELPNQSRILITFNLGKPTAYLIQLRDDGSLSPKSHRCLDEVYFNREYREEREIGRLFDLGQRRFCVVYWSHFIPLLIYVFEIDYDAEYRNLSPPINSDPQPSSKLLSSKICLNSMPFTGVSIMTALCLAPHTSSEGPDMAATSSEGQDMAATSSEGQGKEEKVTSKSSRQKRGKRN